MQHASQQQALLLSTERYERLGEASQPDDLRQLLYGTPKPFAFRLPVLPCGSYTFFFGFFLTSLFLIFSC